MSLRAAFKNFIEKHIVADCPPELDDEVNFGRVADRIARNTGDHPAYVKGQLDHWGKFGIDTSEKNLPALLERYKLREQSIGPRP